MSKFGEPWSVYDDINIRDIKKRGVVFRDEEGGFDRKIDAERTVACVNALADVENPEAVKELLEAIKLAMETPTKFKAGTIPDIVDMKDVLIALFDAYRKIQLTEDAPCEK